MIFNECPSALAEVMEESKLVPFWAHLGQWPCLLLHRVRRCSCSVYHPVACEACCRESFTGLRYKCQRCYNYNLCQDCFWHGRTSGNHQNDHDVKEYSFYVRTSLSSSSLFAVLFMPSRFNSFSDSIVFRLAVCLFTWPDIVTAVSQRTPWNMLVKLTGNKLACFYGPQCRMFQLGHIVASQPVKCV